MWGSVGWLIHWVPRWRHLFGCDPLTLRGCRSNKSKFRDLWRVWGGVICRRSRRGRGVSFWLRYWLWRGLKRSHSYPKVYTKRRMCLLSNYYTRYREEMCACVHACVYSTNSLSTSIQGSPSVCIHSNTGSTIRFSLLPAAAAGFSSVGIFCVCCVCCSNILWVFTWGLIVVVSLWCGCTLEYLWYGSRVKQIKANQSKVKLSKAK